MKYPLVIWALFMSNMAYSAPVVENFERFEMDWGSLKVRFFGESRSSETETEKYNEMQKMAWTDGLSYLSEKLLEVRKSNNCWSSSDETEEKVSADAFDLISKSTYSLKTTYFGEGSLRIQMESSLVKALFPARIELDDREPDSAEGVKHTGVVLELERGIRPCPTYTLVDESGAVLFDSSRVWKSSFEKSFMARWYKKPNKRELRRSVGDNPLRIPAKIDNRGRLLVGRTVWEQVMVGNEPLLSASKVAIVNP